MAGQSTEPEPMQEYGKESSPAANASIFSNNNCSVVVFKEVSFIPRTIKRIIKKHLSLYINNSLIG